MFYKRKDISGRKYGYLEVIESSHTVSRGKANFAVWKCRCICGKIVYAEGVRLRNGTLKSCGCKQYNPAEERLQSKIRINNATKCHEWTGAKDKDGYGKIMVDKRYKKTHRYAYELTFGEIPKGMLIAHACDNPCCCNPNHLFLTDIKGNNLDCRMKGRNVRGRKCHNSKLTEKDVLEIRNLKNKMGGIEIAKLYGVSRASISLILNRKIWKHI